MKLHLPVRLFKSILSCLIPVACLTVGSGVVMAEEQASIILDEQETFTFDYADADTLQDVGGIPQLMGGTQQVLTNRGEREDWISSDFLDSDQQQPVVATSAISTPQIAALSFPTPVYPAPLALAAADTSTAAYTPPTTISIPAGYTEVQVDEVEDITPYSSNVTDVAFRLTADVTVDGRTSPIMTTSSGSWYFTSDSVDKLQSLNVASSQFIVSTYENLEFNKLKSVMFSEASGFALHGRYGSTITLRDNGSVTFSGNTVSATYGHGCAILTEASTVTLRGNGSVTFSENMASSSSYARGGAIYSNGGTITLSENESVTFSENTASGSSYAYGGAICMYFGGSTIMMNNNGSVTFSGNTVSSFDFAQGGAIYGDNDNDSISFINNQKVLFEKNAEVDNGIYRLRSIYTHGNLNLSASESGKIRFDDSIYVGGNLTLNADYTDAENKVHEQTGVITFSGEHTEDHLKAVKGGIAGTADEIAASRESYAETVELHAGRLHVEHGASLAGTNFTALADGAAAVMLKDGVLAYTSSVFGAGTALELEGCNSISGALQMLADSTMLLRLGTENFGTSAMTLNGDLSLANGMSLQLEGGDKGVYRLISLSGNLSGWDTEALRFVDGAGNVLDDSRFIWKDNVLYYANLKSATWSNASGDGLWNNRSYNWAAEGETYADVQGIDVSFGSNAGETVTLAGDLQVGNMLVQSGGNYAFAESAKGASLAVQEKLEIAAGAAADIRLSQGISVGQELRSAGELKANRITGEGDVVITGGSLELEDDTDALSVSGEVSISNATLKGSWTAMDLSIGSSTVETGAEVTLKDVNLHSTLTNEGTLWLGGEVRVQSEGFTKWNYSAGENGYIADVYTLVTGNGNSIALSDVVWTVITDGSSTAYDYYRFSDGNLVAGFFRHTDEYWVNSEVTYDGRSEFDAANTLVLNGGELTLTTALGDNLTGGIRVDAAGTLLIERGVELSTSAMSGMTDDRHVKLQGEGLLNFGSNHIGADGYDFAESWTGTVKLSDIAVDKTLNLSQYSNADSSVQLLDATFGSTLMSDISLQLGGKVIVQSEGVDISSSYVYSDGVNGYRAETLDYILVRGDGTTTTLSGTEWDITRNGESLSISKETLRFDNGVLTAISTQDKSVYWVNGEVIYDGRSEFDSANTLVLNGGKLTLTTALGDNLTNGIRAEADSALHVGAALEKAGDSVLLNVSDGVMVSITEPLSGAGTLQKTGQGSLFMSSLSDTFTGSIDLQQGTLNMAEPLVISKGRELHVGKTDAVLDTTLQLSDGLLCMDFSGTGETVSLNNTNLHLQGETGLQLRDAGKEDGRVYDLFTDIYGLQDVNGNALVLSADNNAAALYFDAERPGTGFWKNATLQLTDEGTLQLVRYTDITIPTGYARTVVMDEPLDFTRYAGLTQDVAFRLAADVTFDASAAVMTNLAASRYFTSASADAPAAIAFRNSENRMFYVKENETLIMKALRAVTFEDLAVSADEAISGGAIYVSDNSGITLEDNGAVIFSGTTLTANGAEAQGGALYAGAASPVVLNGNGSVEFLENSVVGSASYGGAMYADSSVLLSNNNGVIFRDNSSVTQGGAIYAGAELTLTDNGSVEFSGNTSGQGGAIDAAADVVLSANGGISFRENMATSGSGAAINALGVVSLTDNGSVEFSGNTAVTGGGAIYGRTITVSDNIGAVSFIGNVSESSGSSSSLGGAIYGSSQVTFSGNNSVVFKENSAYYRGGAIYTSGTVRLTGNDSVEFRDNVASFHEGGAIYARTVEISDNAGGIVFAGNKAAMDDGGAIYATSSITLSGNGSVEFSENTAKYGGGAIWSSLTVTINNHAGAVLFRGNAASSSTYGGGAVYAGYGVTLSHNGSVEFCANSSVGYGGAIYTSGSVTIAGNDEVTFARNVEKSDSNYRLRSLYLAGDSSADKLTLSAGKGQSISFYDSVYMGATGSVALNADYTDAEGVTQKASGTILFSGATTEDDLKTAKNGVAGTEEEILNSRTSEINSAATLYGGTLQVQDKAVLKLNGGLTVAAGSTATMQVQEGATLNLSSMTIAKDAQASVEVSGGSAMTASGQVSVAEGGLSSLKVQDSRVDWGQSSLALSSGNRIELQDNAEFNLSSMTIAKDAQASIELSGGSVMTASGQVSVTAGGSASLQVQKSELNLNGGLTVAEGSTATMQVQDGATLNLSSMTLAKDAQASIDVIGGSVMTTSGQVSVAAGGSATLKVQESEVNLGSNALALTSGSLVELQKGASLSLSELTVAAGAELKAGGYIAPVAEAAKPVAFSLEGIESDTPIVNTGSVNHVEGNLRLSGGSTLNLQDSYLTVSGDLVLDVTAESEKVVVDLMPGIAKDEFSQVVLFEVAGTVTFGENGTASDSEVVYYQFAEDYFTGDWISQDTWLVYDRNTNLVYLEGVNLIAAVPEPTSSMLGLMGLVAFTLRRRRK